MGFDKDEPGPVVQPQKKTTQVNIWIIVAILAFFVAGYFGIVWVHHHSSEVTQQKTQQMQKEQRAESPEKQQRQQ